MNENHIVIYTPSITNRKEYIFQFLFFEILGVEFKLESSLKKISFDNDIIVNYSTENLERAVQIVPHGLLDELGISKAAPSFGDWKTFCANEVDLGSASVFDPFAFCFYLVTRYEEYISHIKDKLGRFKAENSMGFREGFLAYPVVELCAQQVALRIKQENPNFAIPDKQWHCTYTIDIDNAFAYRGKGLFRNVGGFMRSLIGLQFKAIMDRLMVHLGQKSDPYDTYNYIIEKLSPYAQDTIAFFLVGDYGKLDKNLKWDNRKFQNVVKSLANQFSIGLHPSAGSKNNPQTILVEKKRLSSIVGTNIAKSRQHYLLLDLPNTYTALIAAGIEEDYSMGYPDHIGFRAGTSTPHRFYDLTEDCITNLIVYPFALMDVSLKNYLFLSPEKAAEEIKKVLDSVKAVKGTFMMIWHNESLSSRGEWKGWRSVFETMLVYGKEK